MMESEQHRGRRGRAPQNQPLNSGLWETVFLRHHSAVSQGCPLKLNIDSILAGLLRGEKMNMHFPKRM